MEFDVLVANRRSIRDFAEGVEIPREDMSKPPRKTLDKVAKFL